MIQYRDYQKTLINEAVKKLRKYGLCYAAMEMRTGKTHVSMKAIDFLEVKNLLFVTRKKAMPSVLADYEKGAYRFMIHVINYESLHKVGSIIYDGIIIDEAHSVGAFPKPSLAAKTLRKIVERCKPPYIMLLSGTPSPESYSQLFHQFWVTGRGPWQYFQNFYRWADLYVAKYEIKIKVAITQYDRARVEKIRPEISDYFISYTQQQAGFDNYEIEEEVITIAAPDIVKEMINNVAGIGYYKDDRGEIVADSAVKQMQKIHQISTGTVIADPGSYVINPFKAEWLRDNIWAYGDKIAIYYYYTMEQFMLLRTLKDFPLTHKPEYFNQAEGRSVFYSQIRSGSMGVNLSQADAIFFINITFSAQDYIQARARMGAKDRVKPQKVFWLFSDAGIESRIYNVVRGKERDYTLSYFRRDYGIRSTSSKEDNRLPKQVTGLLRD